MIDDRIQAFVPGDDSAIVYNTRRTTSDHRGRGQRDAAANQEGG